LELFDTKKSHQHGLFFELKDMNNVLDVILNKLSLDEIIGIGFVCAQLYEMVKKYLEKWYFKKIYENFYGENRSVKMDFFGALKENVIYFIPKIVWRKRNELEFIYSDVEFFKRFKTQCLKVVGMFSLILGTGNKMKDFVIESCDGLNAVDTIVSHRDILFSVFYGIRKNVCLFNLKSEKKKKLVKIIKI